MEQPNYKNRNTFPILLSSNSSLVTSVTRQPDPAPSTPPSIWAVLGIQPC